MEVTEPLLATWADLVADLRTPSPATSFLPDHLPKPSPHAQDTGSFRATRFDLPDTATLPLGGPPGRLTFTAQVLEPETTPAVVTVVTYPDGFRVGCVYDITDPAHEDGWTLLDQWLEQTPDGMSFAFDDRATPWVMAQRAWTLRRMHEHLAKAPVGIGLPKIGGVHEAASYGFGSAPAFKTMTQWRRADVLWHVQAAGFWFPDPRHVRWLSTGRPPLVALPPEDLSEMSVLFALHAAGWLAEALTLFAEDDEAWWPQVVAKAQEWEETVRPAIEASPAERMQVGEVASMCALVGMTPGEVTSMIEQSTFSLSGLRTLHSLGRE